MAFSSLSSTLIQVGKAIKKEIFQTLKDNQDDLNTRLGSVEALNQKQEVFNCVIHNTAKAATLNKLLFFESPSDITITEAVISIFDITGKSFGGNFEVDIKVAPLIDGNDFTSAVSVFTTRPSIDMSGASSYDKSSNAVLDVTNQDVSDGQVLRLDITSLPTGDVLTAFRIKIFGEAQ